LPNKTESVAAKEVLSFCADAESKINIATKENSSFIIK